MLIAEEMLQSGDYLIPHLLGVPILTKPPLFYWILAGTFHLFSSSIEILCRVPSALFALAFLQIAFGALRRAELSVEQAFYSVMILLLSPLFLQLSSTAEIDLVFSALTALGLMTIFFAPPSRPAVAVLAYALGAAASLTKGPVALILLVSVDSLWWGPKCLRGELSLFRLLGSRILAAFFAAICVALWIVPAMEAIGPSKLLGDLGYEIVRRFSGIYREPRGPLFYLWSIFIGLFPWSAAAIAGVVISRKLKLNCYSLPIYRFAALATALILLALSVAEGKSSRYSLPAYPFLAILTAPLVNELTSRSKPGRFVVLLPRIVQCIIIVCSGATLALYPGSWVLTLFASVCALYLLAFLQRSSFQFQGRSLFLALCSLAIATRYMESVPYSIYRNTNKSVIADSNLIAFHLKDEQQDKLYALEFSERWYAYYLKRHNIHVRMLTDRETEQFSGRSRINLILSRKNEGWRVDKLKEVDPSTEVIPTLPSSGVIFVRTSGQALQSLKLQSYFPTDLSVPS